ncbi:MAG: hypothetical protein Q9191_005990 [Dirinaria sp. TL-2023a]
MGEDLLRSEPGSDTSYRQPRDSDADSPASPTPALYPSKRRHHEQPSRTLRIPSSETLWSESPRAVHQSLRVHDHYPECLRHDRKDRPRESVRRPPGLAASHQEGFRHHSRTHPQEKARDLEKVEGQDWHEVTHAYRGSFSANHTTIHYPSEDCEDSSEPEDHSLGLVYSDIRVPATVGDDASILILVNLCSPFYAIWVSASAWVAAFFWAFTAIMGDPDGKDGKDDGREAVMGVRHWWERWLGRALR